MLFQDPSHPLDWWAYGGLKFVCEQYARIDPGRDWSYPFAKRRAYKRVHGALNRMYKRTGDRRWRPIGHKQHERLRLQIGRIGLWNNELI